MKKALKKVITVLVAIVVILVVIVAIGLSFADRAIKVGIETAGTKALSVPVTLEKLNLSILGGKVGFQNLVIGNPPDYAHDTLMKLKDAKVAVEIKSLLSDTVNIKEIRLDGLEVTLEQKDIIRSNIQDVIKALPKKEPDEPKEKPKEGKKLHIDTLELTNITVNAKLLPIPGKADTVTLTLPTIKMTDIGGKEDVDTAELAKKILLAISTKIAEIGTDLLPAEMVNTMKDTLSQTMDLGKTATKAAAEEGKKILEQGKDVGKEVEETLEGIKGLFKKKKD